MVLRVLKSTAASASTYSVAIKCSFLRPWLGWTIETGFLRGIPPYDDRAGQAAPFVVSCPGAVPVVARAVEVEARGSFGEVLQPDELAVTVARQDRAVRVVVIVDELELEVATVGEDEDSGLKDQLIRRDPDR